MNSESIRMACIGCGRIAQDHLFAMSSLENVSIVGVVDSQADVVQSVANQYECKGYVTIEDLLNDQTIDAVLVCTPPASHCEVACFFLSRGIHVLCEKPLAITSAEGEVMKRAALASNKILMMATKFRFVDDVVKAKGIIESGVLGRLLFFENTLCSFVDMTKRWNSNPEISGGGVLIDNGTHSIDMARFLLGEIDSVQAVRGPQIQDVAVEDTVRVFFKTRNEVLGSIDLSWSLHKPMDEYVTIYGTEGSLSIGWKRSAYLVRNRQDWIVFGSGYSKREAFIKQHRHFADCIRGNASPIINMEDGIHSINIISAAYTSMKEKKWFKINGNNKNDS